MSSFSSPVSQLLDNLGISYKIVEIPLSPERKPIRALEELLSERHLDPHSIVRSIVFRSGSGGFAVLAAAGTGKADWTLLRQFLNEKRLTMADMEQVLEATGYPVGAVPPIALPDSIRTLVDDSLANYKTVLIGSGVLGYALELESDDLKQALGNAEFGRFIKN